MLFDRRRLARALTDPALRRWWVGTLLTRSAAWVVFLAALADVWRVNHLLVPLMILLTVIVRLGTLVVRVRGARILLAVWLLLYALAIYGRYIEALGPNAPGVILFGVAGALALHGYASDSSRPATEQWALTFAERLALVVGPVLAAGLLLAVDPVGVIIGAGIVLVGVDWIAARRRTSNAAMANKRAQSENLRVSAVYLAAAAGSGAIATSVLIGAFYIGGTDYRYGALAAAVVAVVGLGTTFGALPIPRILLRVPAGALAVALAAIMGLSAATVALLPTPLVAVPALVILGAATATQHSLRVIALRRLSAGSSGVVGASNWALAAGQVVGAAVFLGGPTASGAATLVVLIAVGQFVLVAASLLIGGLRQSFQIGDLSSLPIKSVVHQLSWATRPESELVKAVDSPNARAQRLGKWINRQAQLEKLHVTLPITGRTYEIYRPTDDSRELLFDAGRADPEKQMPYWAKVWPSGVALADVVVERNEEVAGAHVLELGAGLGVTATAVLEQGGRIVTADYGALPLAHCRLNTLVNTSRAPRATCFNWRHDGEVAAAAATPEFKDGFPLIIAGDVLYEGRDAEPLLNVIDRMLTSEGELWLAEPVRRTAQRFLDSAAEQGWDIESRQVRADWPDATDGPVNVHFLKRSTSADPVAADMGGWRI